MSIYLRAAKALHANAHVGGHQGMCIAITRAGKGYDAARPASDLLQEYFKPSKSKKVFWAGRYSTYGYNVSQETLDLIERNLNRRINCLLLMHQITRR